METAIKLAYYRKEDWNRLMEMIDDRDSMDKTWEDWFQNYSKAKKNFESKGAQVIEVVVNLDELNFYCLHRGIPNDGSARAAFVSR